MRGVFVVLKYISSLVSFLFPYIVGRPNGAFTVLNGFHSVLFYNFNVCQDCLGDFSTIVPNFVYQGCDLDNVL